MQVLKTISIKNTTFVLSLPRSDFATVKTSRSVSPSHSYESYENTRKTPRLRTEFDMHVSPTPSRKKDIPKVDRLIVRIRLILRIISFLLASSIVVILSYAAALYRATKDEDIEVEGQEYGVQMVWLTGLKMRPTFVLLGVSCAAMITSLLVLLATCSKVIYRVTDFSNIFTAVVSAIGVFLWLGAGVWYKSDDWNRDMNMDITSYVCRHHGYPALRQVLGNMGALCGALRYVWLAVIIASCIELLSIVTVGWGIIVAKKKGVYVKI
ncbi:hypothetical protein ACET3X_003346 [Alternaria dauci]|uniref:MARVEL domain-containing protein n=1 Tax=Alternaria dauci TaxID=48095 RepID=A0ABR3UUG1_9PLEO